MNLQSILLIAQDAPQSSPFSTLILIPIMLVIMYFIVIRPQRNEEKRRKEMIESLKKGDSVVTSSGIHGKVVEFKEDNKIVILNLGKDSNVVFNSEVILQRKDK